MTRYSPIIDWFQIRASAPGRFILMGEYAEFFNKNAIAMAIDCRTRVTIKTHKEGKLRLYLKNYNNVREWPTTSFTMTKLVAKYADILEYTETIPKILNHLLHKRYFQETNLDDANKINNDQNNTKTIKSSENKDNAIQQANDATMAFLILYVALGDSYAWSSRPSLNVEIESDIPIGRGLGASTSFAVAICAALMKVFRVSAEPYVLSDWASNIERFFHGMNSGLSTSAVVHGGYIHYQSKIKSHGIPHLSQIKVLFIDTNNHKSAKESNSMVTKLLIEQSNRINAILTNIHELVSLCWRKINDAQFSPKSIANQLSANQQQLDSLGLSDPKVNEIASKANLNRLTTKQTQGGDLVFLLFDETDNCRRVHDFREALAEDGYSYDIFDITHKGIDVEVTY